VTTAMPSVTATHGIQPIPLWVRCKLTPAIEIHFTFDKKLGFCTDKRCPNPEFRYSEFMHKCFDRLYTGRVDKLFGLMKRAGLDWRKVDGMSMWPLGTPMLDREGILWHMALA